LPTNDSVLFSVRFCAVHPKDAGDCRLLQFFEVPASLIVAIPGAVLIARPNLFDRCAKDTAQSASGRSKLFVCGHAGAADFRQQCGLSATNAPPNSANMLSVYL
jgi:hypothetical protein